MSRSSSPAAPIHVRAHQREGGRVKVDAYDRGHPPSRIRGVVGDGRANAPGDVQEARRLFAALGRYPVGAEPGPFIDRVLDAAIRGYQNDRGLRQDGWMAPDGPTLASLDADLEALRLLWENPDIIGSVAREQFKAGQGDPMGIPLGLPLKLPMGQSSLEAYRKAFADLAEQDRIASKDRGFDLAASNLAHYLAGSGQARVLSRAEVEREPVLMKAEASNRLLFEAKTFIGLNKDDRKQPLADLPDGGRLTFKDHWETPANWNDDRDRLGSYLALGETGIRSDGSFEAVRRGNIITVTGNVVHRLDSRPGPEND